MNYCLVGDRTSIHLKKWEFFLRAQGYVIFYVDTSGDPKAAPGANTMRVRFDRVGKLLIPFQMLRVACFVLKNRIAVVDVQYVGLNSIVSFFTLGAKQVSTCLGSDIHTDPYRSRLLRLATGFALARADHIFVCGRPLSLELKSLYPTIADKKIIPFSPGVNLDVFQVRDVVTKKYDFVSTRAMQDKYAILPMLDAFVALRRSGVSFKVAIVIAKPNADYFEIVKSKVRHELLNEVDFLPELPQEELAVIYNASRFSVHLPTNEGIGLSVVESALCNCFPITLGHAAYMDYMDTSDMIISKSTNTKDLLEAMVTALQGDYRVSQSLRHRLSEVHSSPLNYMKNLSLIGVN